MSYELSRLTPGQRHRLALSHSAQECRSFLLTRCPDSPQAHRLAEALARIVDALWPEASAAQLAALERGRRTRATGARVKSSAKRRSGTAADSIRRNGGPNHEKK
jgi:hypothetical protein